MARGQAGWKSKARKFADLMGSDGMLKSEVVPVETPTWSSLSGKPTNIATTDDIDANVTAASIKTKLQTVDGAGSGIDADLLDGKHASELGGGGYNMQVFTSSGTYTKSAGVKHIKVTVTGGGGGTRKNSSAGPGGGAGGTAIEFLDAASVSASVAVTVGGGGAYRTTTSNGGTSSFGSYCSASGGSWAARTGGSGSGGTINIEGGDGESGNYNGGAYSNAGGSGGVSYWGGGGGAGVGTTSGTSGQAYGSGGAGRSDYSTGGGGSGKAGVVMVEEFF